MNKKETTIILILIIIAIVILFIQGVKIDRELEKFRNDEFKTEVELQN